MSKAISLKINEEIFEETETILKKMHMPRNSYINRAIAFYNTAMKRRMLKKQFAEESRMVSKNSLEINREFEDMEDEIMGL